MYLGGVLERRMWCCWLVVVELKEVVWLAGSASWVTCTWVDIDEAERMSW